MIRLSVMYPFGGPSFDWNYYLGPHRALAKRLLSPYGLLRIEVDRGLGGFPPGAPPAFHAVGHLFFSSMGELQAAMEQCAADLIADQQNYFQGEAVVQISEAVPA